MNVNKNWDLVNEISKQYLTNKGFKNILYLESDNCKIWFNITKDEQTSIIILDFTDIKNIIVKARNGNKFTEYGRMSLTGFKNQIK